MRRYICAVRKFLEVFGPLMKVLEPAYIAGAAAAFIVCGASAPAPMPGHTGPPVLVERAFSGREASWQPLTSRLLRYPWILH
jgi:hypothetical protein